MRTSLELNDDGLAGLNGELGDGRREPCHSDLARDHKRPQPPLFSTCSSIVSFTVPHSALYPCLEFHSVRLSKNLNLHLLPYLHLVMSNHDRRPCQRRAHHPQLFVHKRVKRLSNLPNLPLVFAKTHARRKNFLRSRNLT